MLIRPFDYTDTAYADAVTMRNAVWPDRPETVALWQYRDRAHDQQYFQQRFVAEESGEMIAIGLCAETSWSYRPGKYFLTVLVHPDHQRRGVGTAVYDHLLAVLGERALPPTMFVSNTREDKVEAIRFLQKRGFEPVMRSPTSRLDITTFDSARFAGVIDRVRASGIQLCAVSQLQSNDPDWQRKIYELDWECTQDEPLPDAPTKPPLENYVKYTFDAPHFLADAWFIAVDNGEYVGTSDCHKNDGNPHQLDTGFTGVLRTHRRRNIALALKLLAIDYAQQNQYKIIETGNEENNPMYQINLTLGFQAQPAWLDFEKMIASEGAANATAT